MRVRNVTRGSVLVERLRVADSSWSRLRGLLGRPPLQTGEGLWIRPSNGVHTFGMKYAIDVVFLDAGKRVLHLYENLPPFRLTQIRLSARSILEMPVPAIAESRTQIGDQLEIGA